jgi:hypothetical protein
MYKIAQKHFGAIVHFWHEMIETGDERQRGYYNWQEVHDAREKVREVEEEDLQNRASEELRETNDEPSGALAPSRIRSLPKDWVEQVISDNPKGT